MGSKWGVLLAVAIFLAAACGACGLKAHPGSLPQESGGQTTSSGGQTTSSGGQTTGSGGQTTDNGGQTTVNGGQTTGNGGVTGTGGRGSGTGGAGSGGSGSGGSTVASTVGVTINGKFVPKEKAVVFIHFGHSNMRGQATVPTSLKPYFYNTEDGLWSYRGSYSLAKEPTAPEGTYTYAGPGMAILHSARAAVASGSDVQFISVGYGVGSKTSVDYQKSGVYYPIFMNWAGQLKGKVTFGAIVIMMGITERHLASDQIPGFPDRMAQIISDMRADLGEPNLPVLFCDYEQLATGDLAPTGAVGQVIMPLVRQMPSKVSKLVLVPTDALEMQDDHHFDMQGQKDWAARVISLMQTNSWFPWK
ncbi:MAG TPA: sialate O-acetylesterase [Polyangia bacterium]